MSLFQGKSDEIQAGRLLVYFDHGSSLLSDTTLDYPMNQDTRMLIRKARPKTFCDAFDEQLDIAEQLYGVQIHFRFSCRDVANLIHSANVYSPEIQNRVIDLIMQQRKKYRYLFDDLTRNRCENDVFLRTDGIICFEKVLGMSMIKQRRETECLTAEQKN